MTAGFHSPLPPVRSGVADYAAALLDAMRRQGPVEIDPPRADVRLYHLGNNQLHRAIYQRALDEPGVIVLHDANLQHFFLGSLTEREYIEEFVYNYGEWSRGQGEEMWRSRARSAADPRYYRSPMLRRILEASRAAIVHNPAAARIARQHAPAARIVEIPHLFQARPVPERADLVRLRRRHGIGEYDSVFGVFGYLRESKRIASVVRAFAGLPNCVLLIAGEFTSSDLERALAADLAQPGIVRIGHTSEADFWRYASLVDACVNLKYPPGGESSGIAIRLGGIGKPVLVTAGEEVSRLPEAGFPRVSPGPSEVAELRAYMAWLAGSRREAAELGRRAAAHIRAHHGLEFVAKSYWDVLQETVR